MLEVNQKFYIKSRRCMSIQHCSRRQTEQKDFFGSNHFYLNDVQVTWATKNTKDSVRQQTGIVTNYTQKVTFGNPDSSHSLIIPMKSIDLAAINSALNADITEFSSKALQ